jgi:hypothetical protein
MDLAQIKADFANFYAVCFTDASECMDKEGYKVNFQSRSLPSSSNPENLTIVQVVSFFRTNDGTTIEFAVLCRYSSEEVDRKAWFVYAVGDQAASLSAEKAQAVMQASVGCYNANFHRLDNIKENYLN